MLGFIIVCLLLYVISNVIEIYKSKKTKVKLDCDSVSSVSPDDVLYSYNKYKGECFEKTVEDLLLSYNSDIKCLRNVILKFDGKSSEIDLLVFHPNGIVSVECKNYQAFVVGREYYNSWLVYYTKTNKFSVLSPIMQNNLHIRAIRRFLPNTYIHNLVVFSKHSRLCKELKELSSVVIENDVIKWFDNLLSGPRIYSDEELNSLYSIIENNRSYDLNSHITYVNDVRQSCGV